MALLGMTSFITDTSSEMLASILPIYLTARLGFTALQFGATDGLMQVATAVTALIGALLADRWRRYREVAGAGYAVSATSRLGLMVARGWLPTLGWLSADRAGKGIRTGPRDALISLSAPRGRVAEAFGLHRMLDTAGALTGPLVAIVLLTLAPGSYFSVFTASFLIAIVGVALLFLFVRNHAPASGTTTTTRTGLASPVRQLWSNAAFRRVAVAGGLLSIAAVSDSFLFLTIRNRVGLDQRWFPTLFVAESLIYLLLAVPFGRLADRIGPGRVLIGGQGALAASYGVIAVFADRVVLLVLTPLFLGVFFAATDGVLVALASHVAPIRSRTTGLAVLGIVLAAGRAVASIGYGAVWQRHGPHAAIISALVAIAIAGTCASRVLRPLLRTGAHDAQTAIDVSTSADDDGIALGREHEPVGTIADPSEHHPTRRLRARMIAFIAIVAVCVAGTGVVTVRSMLSIHAAADASSARLGSVGHSAAAVGKGNPRQLSDLSGSLPDLLGRPHLLILDTSLDYTVSPSARNNNGRIELVDLADPAAPRAPTSLICDRVIERAGRGICLTSDLVNRRYGATIFDPAFRVLFKVALDGLPSRAAISPDGTIGAATGFVEGDAYNVNNFSTRTILIDLVHGRTIADLEDFSVTKAGRMFYPIDRNFWGVSFADQDTFYATMRTGGHYYLVRGHIGARRMDVLRDGVECPSLSPDRTKIAYKSRISNGDPTEPDTWRLHVLDVSTLADHPLAEMRSVDDQVAWLGNDHVLYGLLDPHGSGITQDVWSARSDGGGHPVLVVRNGQSPVVVGA